MKNILVFTFVFSFQLIYLCNVNAQNPGDVLRYKKIGNNLGGLGNVLSSNDYFGADICNIGDVNGDSIDDLAVGANHYGTCGAVFILFMDTNGIVSSQTILEQDSNGISGLTTNGIFGEAVCAMGDINGDGIPDIGIAEMNCSDGGSGTGAIHIITLDSNGSATSQTKISKTTGYLNGGLPLQVGSTFGVSLDSIGDVNNDGVIDLIVGSYYDTQAGIGKGAAWVLLLDSIHKVSSYYKIYDGVANFNAPIDNYDYFGVSCCGIGDYDRDGIPDIAVGCHYDDDGVTDAGAFYIIHLNSTGSVKSFTKISNNSFSNSNPISSNSARALTVIPDLDGNGTCEIVTGAYRLNSDKGGAFILFLDTNENVINYNLINYIDIPAIVSLSRFGSSLCSYGDYNSDGYPEMVVGAYKESSNIGSIYILSLKTVLIIQTTTTPIQCHGDSTATITATGSGSNPPFTYLWSTGDTTNTITGLSAGTYTVTMTNSVNTTTTKSVTISQPSSITLSTTSNTSLCKGSYTILSSYPTGGTGTKITHWSNNLGNANAVAVNPDTTTSYQVYATDANNCISDTTEIIVTVLDLPTVSYSGLNTAYCSNANNAVLLGNPSGGSFTGPGITNTTFNPNTATIGLNEIVYSYTDNNGCIGRDTNSTTVYSSPDIQFNGIQNAYCTNESGFTLSSKVNPQGGSFTVNETSATSFNPISLGVGTYKIKYDITNTSGCRSIDSITTYINPTPTASFSGLSSAYCENSDTSILSATPNGGTFIGSGMTSNIFDPSSSGIGTINISYVYSNMYSCSDTAIQSTTVNTITTTTINTPKTIFCNNDTIVNIIISPQGGTLTGNGVNNATKTFDPISSGVGTQTISYTYTNPYGCTSTQTKEVIVNSPATLSINNLEANYCLNNVAASINGIPQGGIFFGEGIDTINNTFNPTVAGIGVHTISYRYDNGCIDTLSQNTIVNTLPIVSISSLKASYCLNENVDTLIGIPNGGNFLGNGIIGNIFNPQLADTGQHIIQYVSPADNNGCIDTVVENVMVNPLPIISFSSMNADHCIDGDSVMLTASPQGGNFAGQSIKSNYFNPQTAGIGNHNIYYAFTDINNCSNTDSFLIEVHQLPTINFNLENSCININTIPLTAIPIGGTFTGNNVNSNTNTFSPSSAGEGTHQIIYNYTDTYNCSNTDTQNIVVNPLPNLSFNITNPDVCINSDSNLLTAIPQGGIYSGNGVTDSIFYPNTAGVGSHQITYTYTDLNNCINVDTSLIIVHSLPNIIFVNQESDQCENTDQVALTASPIGGTYTGSNVSNNNFYPQTAGVGLHTVYYQYSDNYNCINIDSFVFNVHTLPIITFNPDNSCSNITSMNLTASPTGGIFSGNNIIGNIFNPNMAGEGSHQLLYTYTDNNNCTNIDTQSVIVYGIPSIIFNIQDYDYCEDNSPINLTASPSGGIFTGNGVNVNTFNPQTASIGANEIIYSVTDANQCSNTDTNTLIVHSLPTISFSNYNATNCLNNPKDTIEIQPRGGIFIGAGMTDSIFNPYMAGVGIHTIRYTYTDNFTCSNTDSINIEVFANPIITLIGLDTSYCSNEEGDTLIVNPQGGTFNTPIIVNNVLYPSQAPIGAQTISYSYVDSNNCSSISTTITTINQEPIANAGNDTLIPCNSSGITIGEQSATNMTYVWAPYAGLNNPFTSNPIANPWVNTVFTVTKTNLLTQCSSIDSIEITIPIKPIVEITGDTLICFGDSLHLIASGAPILNWDYNITGTNFDFIPHISQYINVQGIDTNNCETEDSILILVNALPTPDLGADIEIYDQDSAVLNPGTFSTYSWNTGAISPTITVKANTLSNGIYNYAVKVEDQNGCSASDTVLISITTSIDNLEQIKSNIKIYPNPTRGLVTLEWSEEIEIKSIETYDSFGKLLKIESIEYSNNELQIDLRNYAKGLYLIKVKTSSGKSVIKVMVE